MNIYLNILVLFVFQNICHKDMNYDDYIFLLLFYYHH